MIRISTDEAVSLLTPARKTELRFLVVDELSMRDVRRVAAEIAAMSQVDVPGARLGGVGLGGILAAKAT